jgi:amino-acid N-acetyltransferase
MEASELEFKRASADDLEHVHKFLTPFMNGMLLLPRTSLELELLLRNAFVARCNGEVIGFAAIEIYSRKLAEIHCLAVSESFQRRGVGRTLVGMCVQRAREKNVIELMAISSSDEMFRSCGFDFSLPNQKRAFFIQPLE